MREDEMTSGLLQIGRITFAPRSIRVSRNSLEDFGMFSDAYSWSVISERAMDVDEIGKAYEARECGIHINERGHRHEVVVNKHTHRICFENETEHEVTIVVEPK